MLLSRLLVLVCTSCQSHGYISFAASSCGPVRPFCSGCQNDTTHASLQELGRRHVWRSDVDTDCAAASAPHALHHCNCLAPSVPLSLAFALLCFASFLCLSLLSVLPRAVSGSLGCQGRSRAQLAWLVGVVVVPVPAVVGLFAAAFFLKLSC